MMASDIHPDTIAAFLYGAHGTPFEVLGPHPVDGGKIVIRAFRPSAQAMWVIAEGERLPMNQLRGEGFFEITIPSQGPGLKYHFETTTRDGRQEIFADPYAFASLLTDYDLYLFGEGRFLNSYDKFGAHLREIDGVKGVNFAVWAPNAHRVSIIGNFNGWDARVHPMRRHDPIGVWELFVPGLSEGEIYRYDVRSRFHAYHAEKTDPYGFFAERRPANASIVVNINGYDWGDAEWMTRRAETRLLNQPMAIYEVHLGSWRRNQHGKWLTYRELADTLVAYVKDMNYTHVELMPVMEHPLDASWGYQVTGYYAPTSRFGTPADFMYLVDTLHQNGIGVLLDWVPAHFPKDGHGLSYFDGTHLYEHADPRKGEHPDWGTYIFNYGLNEVRNFLLSNALYWLKEYHIDGLRVDAVSSMLQLNFSREPGQWIPNQYGGSENLEAIAFLKELNTLVHAECPGAMTVAEESTDWPMVSRPTYIGGLGFTFKWNMGWMHDTLDYMKLDPVFRRFHHNKMTFSLLYAFNENFVLALSHDEVVHLKGSLMTKMSGDWWKKFASLRLLFGYQYTHPGKKLNFMGQEFGQWQEWSEARSLDWFLLDLPTHASMQAWSRDLNIFYLGQPALYERDFDWEGFEWIDANDADQSIFTYVRFAEDPSDFLVIACNFTPIVRYDYTVGVPEAGRYLELMNSDSSLYGGSNVGNGGSVMTEPVPSHQYRQRLRLTLPPLAILILKLETPVKPQIVEKSE